MNKYELFESIGYISDKKIDQADYYHNDKRKIKPVFKYAGIVFASVTLIIGGAIFVYTRNEYENNKMLSNGAKQSEDDEEKSLKDSFIIYNKEYYYFSDQSLSEADIDSFIGYGKVVFYNSSHQKLTEIYNVYSIKHESLSEKIAIKIDNEYYIFSNDKAR